MVRLGPGWRLTAVITIHLMERDFMLLLPLLLVYLVVVFLVVHTFIMIYSALVQLTVEL
jgi:hypothetical protein